MVPSLKCKASSMPSPKDLKLLGLGGGQAMSPVPLKNVRASWGRHVLQMVSILVSCGSSVATKASWRG